MSDTHRQARTDLAAALRLAARMGLHEGICNHFSYAVPGGEDRFLLNPHGLHWSEIRAGDLLLVDATGKVLEGGGEAEVSACLASTRPCTGATPGGAASCTPTCRTPRR